MKRWAGIVLGLAVIAIAGVVAWYRNQPGEADYIAAAQNGAAVGQRTNLSVLGEACETVEWVYSRGEDGKHLVTARGHLKHGDRSVEVKWEVTLLRDGNAKVSLAKPISAVVGGEDIQPPSAFPAKIAPATPDK
jgi:hypothetical protein